MILIDRHIKDLANGIVSYDLQFWYSQFFDRMPSTVKPLVTPFDADLVNPHSLDVRIGFEGKLRVTSGYITVNLNDNFKESPYWLQPGDRLLVESLEVFNIPEFTACSFYLKSSRGREWYGHQLAGYIDAGWHNSRLTMEITNDDLAPLPIYPGMRFGQLEFRLLLGLPDKSYRLTGRYNNDLTVQGSKG